VKEQSVSVLMERNLWTDNEVLVSSRRNVRYIIRCFERNSGGNLIQRVVFGYGPIWKFYLHKL